MRPAPVSSFPFLPSQKNLLFLPQEKILFIASEILLVAFTRDTPPYPLSIDGGTDWGKYRISSDAVRTGRYAPTYSTNFQTGLPV